jgi:four helix bundle protein
MKDPDGLAEWSAQVPQVMRDDTIWRLPAYRFSLYLGDLAQVTDVPRIRRDYRTRRHIGQMLDAVQSISANIAEGYGRTTGPERARFFEYAESSARESRDWYFKIRHALDPDVANARIELISRIMKILATAIIRERADSNSRARRAYPGAQRELSRSGRSHRSEPPAPSTSSQPRADRTR